MNCIVCGTELQTDEQQQCSSCSSARENKVTVLTVEEKQHFNGVTLEQGYNQQTNEHRNNQYDQGNTRIYSTNFKVVKTGFLTTIVIGIILAVILAIVIFVALPIVIITIGIALLSLYFIRR